MNSMLTTLLLADAVKVRKYSPDQARDEAGKWTDGGGGGAEKSPSIKVFAAELRSAGFKKDWDSKAGGGRTVQYSKEIKDSTQKKNGSRKIEVQLNDDGKHRVSNMLNGRGITTPTDFHSMKGMQRAIDYESRRTDHPLPGKGYGPSTPENKPFKAD
jgi:hypothetical protein